MKIPLFFFVLTLIDYITLKFMAQRHFDTRGITRFNEFFSILLTINLIAIVLSYFSAAMVFRTLGLEALYTVGYLTLDGTVLLVVTFVLWKRWKKLRHSRNFFDITNELKFK
jgi:uncharacterized membrane protein YhdT